MSKKTMLVIPDGYGINETEDFNAVLKADSPNLDKIFRSGTYPSSKLNASGLAVGLPDGQMGNSEVGHMNIGAGRVVYQDLTKISKEIADNKFSSNKVLNDALDNCVKNNVPLHLLGLISDGGVHSHQDHMLAIIKAAKEKNVKEVYLHAFMDGRDTSPTEGKSFIKYCMDGMESIGLGEIATITGRYWAMDRDKRWERVNKAFNGLVHGVGEKINHNEIPEMFDACYAKDEKDEFINPKIIIKNGSPVSKINSKDSVIFFNFRADRAREMTMALNDENFDYFDRGKYPENLYYVTMTKYEAKFQYPVMYPKEILRNVIGEVISNNKLKQYRTAETEKYAHVTYFLNGGEEKVFEGEERGLVDSPKVATYDMKPEMSAYEVTENLCNTFKTRPDISFYVINYANCDMVGHTGIMEAAVKAVEAIDECLQKTLDTFFENGGEYVLITADHGNAEQMIDYDTKEPFTEHTLNQVPLILVSKDNKLKMKDSGALCDIAPTILNLMNLPVPEEMDGKNLIL